MHSDALRSAGFNPDKGWILILKVKGEPKKNKSSDLFLVLNQSSSSSDSGSDNNNIVKVTR